LEHPFFLSTRRSGHSEKLREAEVLPAKSNDEGRPSDELLFREYHRLQSGYFKTFTAPNILAAQYVVLTKHVRLCLGKAGTVALIGVARKLLFSGAHDPGDFVVPWLVAVRTVQRGLFLFRTFVEKLALFHIALRFLSKLINYSTPFRADRECH
jgi:hypothetical protein